LKIYYYICIRISENIVNGLSPFAAEGSPLFINGSMERGVIHTFKYKRDALLFVKKYSTKAKKNWKVFKSIIPKGTPYYTGIFGKWNSFGSKSIIFKKQTSSFFVELLTLLKIKPFKPLISF